jgi:MFS family permease
MKKGTFGEVFGNRDFRLLWIGEGVSLLGDQFYLIALPWLVLQLTGNAFAIGTVLALVAIPRAVFMLIGGALTDRLSPRVIMLCSNIIRMVLVSALAALTVTGLIELWMLYVFALLFGLADAFFFPAQSAIIPRLLGADRLQTGNAVIQGTAQLSLFLGPVLAGTLIAVLDGGGAGGAATVPDLWGIGVAFMFDAASFLVSAVTLAMIDVPPIPVAAAARQAGGPAAGLTGSTVGAPEDLAAPSLSAKSRPGLFSSIGDGLALVWKDKTLRYYFGLIGVVNLLMSGPISVGIPVLADTRYAGGAAGFGVILSAFGAGSLTGVVIAGVRRRPSARRFPMIMLGLTASMGIGLALLGILSSTVAAAVVAALMGLGQGYVVIQFITWLQLRTAPHMLGRMMSVLMFAVVGLSPLSSTVSGALIQWNAQAVMIGAGILMFAVVGIAALSPSVWRLGDDQAAPAADDDPRATVSVLPRFEASEVPELAA